MREYGMALGIGFQISDDVLDYTAKEKRLGKTLGDDFREGKMTLPVICAIAKATPAETEFWDRCITDRDQKDGDFEEALELLRKHGALDEAMAVARSQGAAGEMALRTLPDGPLRQEMSELIRFAVERDY